MIMEENAIENRHPKYGNIMKKKKKIYTKYIGDLIKKIKRYRYGKNTISGVYYDKDKRRLMWYSYHDKYLRKLSNRKVRRHREEIRSGSSYRKIFDYKYFAY